jgi:predicted metal-dependent hydrolase
MKKKVQSVQMKIAGHQVPVKIHWERRRGLRASVGKDSFLFRLPQWLNKQQEEEAFEWFQQWAVKALKKNETLLSQFNGRSFRDGEELQVGPRRYTLRIRREHRKTHAARLENGVISLKLSHNQEGAALNKSIRTLLSRIIGQDFLPAITRRVHELNDLHFQKKIKAIRLKYNHSNWGSCSHHGNVNLSTRLLFAPPEVIDYVIIHELAHLIELNHSPRFWRIVKKAMPDYKEKVKWLRENRDKCDF